MRTSAAHAVVMAAVAVALVAPLRATAQNPRAHQQLSRRAARRTAGPRGYPRGGPAPRHGGASRATRCAAAKRYARRVAGVGVARRARARAAGLDAGRRRRDVLPVLAHAARRHVAREPRELRRHAPRPGSEAVVATPVDATIDAPVLAVSTGTTPDSSAARGKVLVTTLRAPADLGGRTKRNDTFIYTPRVMFEEQRRLSKLEAAAIVVICDSIADAGFQFPSTWIHRGGHAGSTRSARAHARRAKARR